MGREVCVVTVWERAGGYRFTVVGLAEGRKKAFQTPTRKLLRQPPTYALYVLKQKFGANGDAEF